MWGSFSSCPLSESSVSYASLRSGATSSSGSEVWVAFLALDASFWEPRVGGDVVHGGSVGLYFVTDTRQQTENYFPFLHMECWNFGFFCPSVLQTQAAGQPCHNFFCIFRCMKKGQVSLSFASQCQQTVLFKYEPWGFCSTLSAGVGDNSSGFSAASPRPSLEHLVSQAGWGSRIPV